MGEVWFLGFYSVVDAAQGGILEKKLCDAMQCWIAERKMCYTQAEQRAYVGTTCGNHKWCMKGKCVEDPRAGTAKGAWLGLLSLASLRGRLIEYQLRLG